MSLGEKGVFGLLAVSIGIGVYQLATSPWGEQASPSKTNSSSDATTVGSSSSSFGQQEQIQQVKSPTVLELTEDLKPKRTTLAVEDGITEIDETLQPPKVNDGVTGIKFGDPARR